MVTEFGILCDRRWMGLGRTLLATGSTPEHLWARALEACTVKIEHPHLLVERTVTTSDWSSPIESENAGGESQ